MKNKIFLFILLLMNNSGCLERADESGFMVYKGEELQLNREYIPLSVFYVNQDIPGAALSQLWNAVNYVNQSFGFVLFLDPVQWQVENLSHAPRGTVFFLGGTNVDDNKLATTSHNLDPGAIIESAEVTIFNNQEELTTKEMYLYIIVHELGHVLGLDHDYNSCSIMYPSYNETDCLSTYCCIPEERKFTDHDIDLVRSVLFLENS